MGFTGGGEGRRNCGAAGGPGYLSRWHVRIAQGFLDLPNLLAPMPSGMVVGVRALCCLRVDKLAHRRQLVHAVHFVQRWGAVTVQRLRLHRGLFLKEELLLLLLLLLLPLLPVRY